MTSLKRTGSSFDRDCVAELGAAPAAPAMANPVCACQAAQAPMMMQSAAVCRSSFSIFSLFVFFALFFLCVLHSSVLL